jgi:hypothetical protein
MRLMALETWRLTGPFEKAVSKGAKEHLAIG